MSEQQEEILYFVKESIELENKQIQEVVIGQFYIVFVSFSGSIYIFQKGNESDENQDDEDNYDLNNSSSDTVESNQAIKSREERHVEKKKNLFLDFDHKLELPFAKTLIISDNQKEIKLLIVAKNGDMCDLTINIDQFKIISYQQKMQTLDIPKKEEKQIKNAKIIENTKLLIIYPFQIYLIQNEFNKEIIFMIAKMIFEVDVEIDQIDYYDNILCISTKKRYYALDLTNLQSIKLGSAKSIEMQDFYGITFFPRNQNEFVMAARPNGNMWKAQTDTGKVLTTLQFTDEDNNKLNFGRLYAFNRYILSINGQNRLYIIDMNDKQLITKVYHNCSQLSFVYNHFNITGTDHKHEQVEKSFYLYYMENGKNLVIERCSIKNIQRSFEASLSKNFVGQCAELFEKYEALQNIKNLKSILKANMLSPPQMRYQFSSSFKDSVKRIEEDEFQWVREKEIDQKSFKENITLLKNNKNSQGQIHNQPEEDIIKIIDIDGLKTQNKNDKQNIKQVSPKISALTFSVITHDIEKEIQERKIINNNQFKVNNQKKHFNSNTQDFNTDKDQIQEQFCKNTLEQNYQNFDSKQINQTNLFNKIQVLMLEKSIKKNNQQQKDFQQTNNQISNLIGNLNKFISIKINYYGKKIFKQQLLSTLIERNRDMIDFIDIKLSTYSICHIMQHLSRNFMKKFLEIPCNSFYSYFMNSEITYVIQFKSTKDILNDTSISIQYTKYRLLQLLQYFLGEDSLNDLIEINDGIIDFDYISIIINQFKNY